MDRPRVYDISNQPNNTFSCLRIGVVEYVGMLGLREGPDGLRGSGPIVPLMEMIALSLKTCFVYIVPQDRLFGVRLNNDTWNGIFGLVKEQKVDMSGVPVLMSPERYKLFDAGEWIQSAFRSIAHARPKPQADILGFLKPFTIQVWGLFLATVLAVWMCMYATQRLQHSNVREVEGSTSGRTRAAVGWTSFLWAYVHPLSQTSAWLPRGGVRLAAGVWLMLTLVLTQMYRSNLKAMMILPRLSLPFDTLEGLIESGIPCYIVPSTKFHNAILEAEPHSQFGRLRGQMVSYNNFRRASRDLIQGKHAAIASHISLLSIIHSTFRNTATCPLYLASETVQPEWSFFIYEKNSSLRLKVDVIIQRLRESGIMERLLLEEQRDARNCLEGSASDLSGRLRALEFKDYYGVLMMYCGGMMLAGMALLMEMILGGINPTHGSPIFYLFGSVPPARVPWTDVFPAASAELK